MGDDTGDLAAGELRRHWRPSGLGVEMTLETKRLVTGDDTGDLAAGEWRGHWGVKTTHEI